MMISKNKKIFKPPKVPKGMTEGLRVFLDEQKSAFLPEIHLEVLDDGQAVLEGCKGVLAYSSEFIRLSCGRRMITFTGTELELRCLSSSTAVITGTILDIRFEA